MRNIDEKFLVLLAAVVIAGIGYFGISGAVSVVGNGAAVKVDDRAALMSPEQSGWIGQYHQKLLEEFDIDYRVLTVSGTSEDINAFAFHAFRQDGVGSNSKSGRGLLLVIDSKGGLVRLEVSAALEGIYTDAFVRYIEERQMVPFFRESRVADGVLATTELIFSRAMDAQDGQEFVPPIESFSSGGGAKTASQIGAGPDMTYRQGTTTESQESQGSPAQVVELYLRAMKERLGSPDLPIYSEPTKRMMANWTVTPAQMDNVAKTYARCPVESIKVGGGPYAAYAVVRYGVDDRQCSPYFLVQENGGWKLDLTMMQRGLGFNHKNEWHFRGAIPAEYAFAFNDWNFDQHGFPHHMPKLRWAVTVTSAPDGWTYVTWVGEASAAEKMGLQVGDRVLKWENIERPFHTEISKRLSDVGEGDIVTVIVNRGGQDITLSMKAPPKVE
jgi:uncharacterized protein